MGLGTIFIWFILLAYIIFLHRIMDKTDTALMDAVLKQKELLNKEIEQRKLADEKLMGVLRKVYNQLKK